MDYRFARSMQGYKTSAVREILKLTQGKDVISFAGGLPAEEFFPVEAVRAAFERLFKGGPGVLQYGLTEGYRPLRETLAKRLGAQGIQCTADSMLLTTGSQQAIDLLGRVFLDPGDVVLVQQPTYLAALQAFQAHQAHIVPVMGDADGMWMDDLEAKLRELRPKFVYVCPTFGNPTGHSWTLERRRELIGTCLAQQTLIVEDNPYGELYFEADANLPTGPQLAGEMFGETGAAAVAYMGTFSKIVAPALRTGWIVAERRIIGHMAQSKQAADLHSSSLDQQGLYHLLRQFDLEAHLAIIRREYKLRLETMARMLRGADGAGQDTPGFQFHEPRGGMFIWVELPEGTDAAQLLEYAVREGVAFVPGAPFHAQAPRHNTARLNFTHSDVATIETGVQRLQQAMLRFQMAHDAADNALSTAPV